MTRPVTALNDLEFSRMVRTKCTNDELSVLMENSFRERCGNLREVIGDLIDMIQNLYMERTELEFHLSPKVEEGIAADENPSKPKEKDDKSDERIFRDRG